MKRGMELTQAETAFVLGRTGARVSQLTKDGKLKGRQLPGTVKKTGDWRYSEKDVAKFIQKRTDEETSKRKQAFARLAATVASINLRRKEE